MGRKISAILLACIMLFSTPLNVYAADLTDDVTIENSNESADSESESALFSLPEEVPQVNEPVVEEPQIEGKR